MNTSAWIMMVTTLSVVSLVTGYFFARVLATPPKPEQDSYSENQGSAEELP